MEARALARPARLRTLNPNPAILSGSAHQSRSYRILEHVLNLGAQVLLSSKSAIKRLLLPDTSDVPRPFADPVRRDARSEEHTSELQSHSDLVCRLLLEKKKTL